VKLPAVPNRAKVALQHKQTLQGKNTPIYPARAFDQEIFEYRIHSRLELLSITTVHQYHCFASMPRLTQNGIDLQND